METEVDVKMEATIPIKNGVHADLAMDHDEQEEIKKTEIDCQRLDNIVSKEAEREVTEDERIGKEVVGNGKVQNHVTDHKGDAKDVNGEKNGERKTSEKGIASACKNEDNDGKQSNQKLDNMNYPLATTIISGEELIIDITQYPDGEIQKLKIYESGNSVAIFYQEYEKLEDCESPIRDPSFIPELSEYLGPASPSPPINGSESSNFSSFQQHERKNKRLLRLELEDNEGIVSKHSTFFPAKIKKRDSKHMDVSSENYYDMSSFPRGTLTLLNVRNFRCSSGMSQYPRHGTDRDADGLCALFLELGFIVERYDNPTKKIMTSALENAAAEEKLSCSACAILTHGDEGIMYATDQKLDVLEMTKLFRKRNLAGKPKLFIFQACQGSDYMNSFDKLDGPVTSNEETSVKLPCEADFLYAYSTVPGYFSWRNSRQGSWFVQAVCSVFREYGHVMDVHRMLTRVNDKISGRKSITDNLETDDKRQVASIVSQMRKDFFFFPPYGPLPLI